MLNSTRNEVLTELSLNGVGVGNLMFRASTAQSRKAGRNPNYWTALVSKQDGGLKKSRDKVVQARTEDNPGYYVLPKTNK